MLIFMVKIKGIEGVLITADNYKELLKAVNNEIDNYDGFQPSMTIVDEHRAIIYHSEIPEDAPLEEWETRKCCECGNYDWGRGCPFREGRVTLMMDACHHFTIEVKGE